jgi:flagellar biosynthesis protein
VKPPPKTLAVAVAYEAPNVPRVVAVGSGALGERIIETAREHGVPIEQNAALAQALSTIEIDEEIPEQLYTAIAQILAFILRASGKLPPPNQEPAAAVRRPPLALPPRLSR